MEANNHDIEENINSEVDLMVRCGFIRKVYGVIFAQTTFSVGITALALIESFKHAMESWYVLGGTLTTFLLLTLLLLSSRNLCRQVPTNYVLISFWTISFSLIVCYVAMALDPLLCLTAVGGAAFISGGLTVLTSSLKSEYTIRHCTIFSLVACIFICGILAASFGFSGNKSWIFVVLIDFIFSLFLISGTFRMISAFGSKYDYDDHIFASIHIYISVLMFLCHIA